MNSKLIRQINTGRIFSAIRQRPGITQTEIREATELDRSTISTIVTALEHNGLVSRMKTAKDHTMGRPEEAFSIQPSAGLMVGLSVGETNLRVAAAGLDGMPRSANVTRMDMDGDAILLETKRLVNEILDEQVSEAAALVGVGVTLPARRRPSGDLSSASILWDDKKFRDELASLFSCRVNVDEETNAAALAESHFGAARGARSFIFVHGDTHISGALYLDNRVFRGVGGFAGSIAHMKVEPDGRTCACGARGCLQAYITEQALLERLTDFGFAFQSSADIDAAARREDRLVRTVLSEAGTYLGLALANTVNLLNVGDIVLGGSLASLAHHMVPAINNIVRTNIVGGDAASVRIRRSGLTENFNDLAAISLAMDAFMPTHAEWGADI